MRHLRAARLAKKLKREAKEKEEHLPKELVSQADGNEEGGLERERPEEVNGSDLDGGCSGGARDCEITDSEGQELTQANTSALEILTASSYKHGAFDNTFAYQRGPEPSERTLFRRSQQEREQRKAAENTPTLHTFFSTVSGQPAAIPISPTLSTNERKQQERSTAIMALEKKLASKKEGLSASLVFICLLLDISDVVSMFFLLRNQVRIKKSTSLFYFPSLPFKLPRSLSTSISISLHAARRALAVAPPLPKQEFDEITYVAGSCSGGLTWSAAADRRAVGCGGGWVAIMAADRGSSRSYGDSGGDGGGGSMGDHAAEGDDGVRRRRRCGRECNPMSYGSSATAVGFLCM